MSDAVLMTLIICITLVFICSRTERVSKVEQKEEERNE